MKLGPIPSKKLLSVFSSLGYAAVRQTGSHLVLKKEEKTIVIPMHNREIGPGLLRLILKEADLSRDEFFKLLGKK
jgi:predicted RNA binding protein YcfA (HicA-like mRNA interferase family)